MISGINVRKPITNQPLRGKSGIDINKLIFLITFHAKFKVKLYFARVGAFIYQAFKAGAIVNYASALITQEMEVSGSPMG